MELYWASGSPYSWRVMLGLMFKGLDYTDHVLSLDDREHKQAGYTALNPRARVPTLVDGELVITESLAILAYLDHVYRRKPLFGTSGYDAARIWRRVMELENYAVAEAQPVVRALFFNTWLSDLDGLRVKTARTFKELDTLEETLEGGPFTAVDCMIVPLVKSLERASTKSGASNVGLLPLNLAKRWPRLAARVVEVEAHPGYDRTFPPHWR
ncbi:MAG: glutathione S-transferase family protein [Myxococcota bacterium]